MTTNVLDQNLHEILTYFVRFFLSIHFSMIIELHGDNYNYFYNYGQYKLSIVSY
jgi:hypothetical protein